MNRKCQVGINPAWGGKSFRDILKYEVDKLSNHKGIDRDLVIDQIIIAHTMESIRIYEPMRKEVLGLRKQLEEPKWMPIESAPKDGTDVLLSMGEIDQTAIGQWVPEHKENPDTTVSGQWHSNASWYAEDMKWKLWAPIPNIPTPPKKEGEG